MRVAKGASDRLNRDALK
jgi:uncharacterized protein YjbJ (UPF0337 family)